MAVRTSLLRAVKDIKRIELPKVFDRRANQSFAVGFFRNIRLRRERLSAHLTDTRNDRVGSLFGTAVIHHYPRTHGGQLFRQRSTHARAGTGYQYDSTCYIHFRFSPRTSLNASQCIG